MTIKDFKNFLALTFACLLLVTIKATALLQYWQQSRHILLQWDVETLKPKMVLVNAFNEKLPEIPPAFLQESNKRFILAGQILVSGLEAMPKPATIIIKQPATAMCPKPVAPTEIALPETPKINTPVATNHPATSTPVPQTAVTTSTTENAISNKDFNIANGEKVLLIGDSMMQGVAPHLAFTLRRKYGIESVDLGTKSTGLTYPSFFDWPAHVEEEFSKDHYAALIVLLGANDTWDMVQNNRYIKFGSDPWRQLYGERIERILTAAEAKQTKVLWLAAPPMGREDLVDRIPVLNEVIENIIIKHTSFARFVTTANSLTSDGKTFTKFIEVPERGSVMVRTDDGVHFTPFGQELLAKLVISQLTLVPINSSLSRNH